MARSNSRRSSMRSRVQKRAQERKFSGGSYIKIPKNVKWFNPKEDTYHLDFLPFIIKDPKNKMGNIGENWYELTYLRHTRIGGDNRKIVCPRTINKPCPICKARKELMCDWDNNKEDIKEWRAGERQLFNVLLHEESINSIKLFDISTDGFGEMLEKEIREGKDEWGDFADIINGYTLKVRFEDKPIGKNPYFKTDRIDFEERKDYDNSILEKTLCLDPSEILVILPYDEIEKIFLEMEEEDNETSDTTAHTEETPDTTSSPKPEKKTLPKAPENKCLVGGEWGEFDVYNECDDCAVREKCKKDSPKNENTEKVTEKSIDLTDSSETSECPHGETWGKSCDKFDQCYECDVWETCKNAQNLAKL